MLLHMTRLCVHVKIWNRFDSCFILKRQFRNSVSSSLPHEDFVYVERRRAMKTVWKSLTCSRWKCVHEKLCHASSRLKFSVKKLEKWALRPWQSYWQKTPASTRRRAKLSETECLLRKKMEFTRVFFGKALYYLSTSSCLPGLNHLLFW